MINIFKYLDYKVFLKDFVGDAKSKNKSHNYSKLARAIGVQKTYLSKVLQNKAELSEDQAYLVAKYLRLSVREHQYFSLLVCWQKSALLERKEKLKTEIDQWQSRELNTEEVLRPVVFEDDIEKQANYYLDPMIQFVHFKLMIDKYRKNPRLIAKEHSLSKQRLDDILQKLVELNFIAISQNDITLLKKSLHLPRESSLRFAYQALTKIETMGALHRHNDPSDYTYTSIFASDAKFKRKFLESFLSLLKELDPELKKSPCEELFQVNFDLVGRP